MANGYLPTGISTEPINIAGAGQQLMQTAVEQKLADIEQGRAMADESQKAALEAMSMKTIQGLDRKLQDKYSDQFDQHRQKIVDMLSKSGGVLDRKQQMQIRNEQQDIINQTMADNEVMKQFEETAKFFRDPNAQYGYNVPAALQELRRQQKAFEKGEYSGDPRTIIMKHQVEAPVSGYIANRYADAIKSLDVESLGDFEGNVFTQTELTGLNAQAQESIEKARRLRDQIMQDPNVVRRYTANDGTVFEDRKAEVQQQIEDAISKKISETKPYRQTTSSGSRSKFEPYVVDEPIDDVVTVTMQKEGDKGETTKTDIPIYVEKSVPMSNVPSFVYDGNKMAVEAVEYVPVAVDQDAYAKWVKDKRMAKAQGEEAYYGKFRKDALPEHGMLRKEDVGEYKGAVINKPFAKVGTTKSRNPFDSYEAMLTNVDPKDLNVKFLPFEGALKGAILAKTLTRKDAYESKFNELDAQTKQRESAKETPSFSMAELKAAGYSDKQINDAVEAGKITIK